MYTTASYMTLYQLKSYTPILYVIAVILNGKGSSNVMYGLIGKGSSNWCDVWFNW